MFDIGWGELVVIGIVALIAIGPKELPTVLRTLAQFMGKVRRMASEFQGQFQEALREAEVADLKKQAEDLSSTVTDFTNFDPLDSVRKEVESVTGDLTGALDQKAAENLPASESTTTAAAPTPPPEPATATPADPAPPAPAAPGERP